MTQYTNGNNIISLVENATLEIAAFHLRDIFSKSEEIPYSLFSNKILNGNLKESYSEHVLQQALRLLEEWGYVKKSNGSVRFNPNEW